MNLNILHDQFVHTVKNEIHRDGIENLLSWLETTDFYTAPASAKYHSCFPGGLCLHSLNVHKRIMTKVSASDGIDQESLSIVSLFHDLCKANFYKQDLRNTKDESGQWIKVPYYTFDDQFPLGHGEKSLFLIQRHIELTNEEALAVRWHMGNFGLMIGSNEMIALNNAMRKSRLLIMLQQADTEAAFWDETV
jgi:hypothetical protein